MFNFWPSPTPSSTKKIQKEPLEPKHAKIQPKPKPNPRPPVTVSNEAVALFALGTATLTGMYLMSRGMRVYHLFFKRIRNSDFVSGEDLAEKRWIKGVVTRWVACLLVGCCLIQDQGGR
jgi:hypothetical protein